jgi:hypothetical protein
MHALLKVISMVLRIVAEPMDTKLQRVKPSNKLIQAKIMGE